MSEWDFFLLRSSSHKRGDDVKKALFFLDKSHEGETEVREKMSLGEDHYGQGKEASLL